MVGIIGLGLLGSAIADRLGSDALGFDIDSARSHCASANEVFARSQTVFLALPNASVSTRILNDAEILPGAVVLDATTGDPAQMATLSALMESRRVHYLDTCVGGSSTQVRAGLAILLVGGDVEILERYRPLLNRIAKRIFHMGPAGSGARMKLAHNLVLGLNRAVLGEGLALARKLGLDPAQALEVFRAGAAYSSVMDNKGPKMLAGDFTPEARLAQHRKDVDLILAAAAESGSPAPLSELHRILLVKLEEQGYGDVDNSAIIRAFWTNEANSKA